MELTIERNFYVSKPAVYELVDAIMSANYTPYAQFTNEFNDYNSYVSNYHAYNKPITVALIEKIYAIIDKSVLYGSGGGGTGTVEPYIHTQSTASNVWTINHNLARTISSVRVEDSNGEDAVGGEINETNNNALVITFGDSFTGRAVLL